MATSNTKIFKAYSYSEIADPKNDYNLNIPRYIDSQEAEDIQDIEAHLLGGIPKRDIEALDNYWKVYPNNEKPLYTKPLISDQTFTNSILPTKKLKAPFSTILNLLPLAKADG
jgi:hypothetical protein